MISKPASVMVAGATGFIARALFRCLETLEIPARALVFTDRKQQKRIPRRAGLEIHEASSTDTASMQQAFRKAAPEIVVNLAAGGVSPDERQPDNLGAGNEGLLSRLLEACAKNPPRLFLHAGSWSEYGPADENALITEDHPVTPTSEYGAAKAAATHLGSTLAPELGVPMATLRLFHVFGIGERDYRLIPSLMKGLNAGLPVDLTPGDQVRDFIYVDDVADAFAAAWDAADLEPYQVFNVCSGSPVTVRAVAENVADAMDKPRDLLNFGALEKRDDEEPWVVGDNAKFAGATGWRPRITLDEGIRRMVADGGS